jgi:alpha-L-rhamnosidase
VAPGKRITAPNGNTDWGAGLVMIPWYHYLYYGDADTLREHYPAMRQFVLGVKALAKDGIVSKGYGDWCPPGSVQPVETPVELTTTAWLWRIADVMSRVANVAGHPNDAPEYERLATDTANAFNVRFFNSENGTYGSQTADAIALAWGLVPAGREHDVADALARDVVDHHKLHHSTGIFGSRYLYAALASYGHADVAMSLLHQTTYPSIGDLISRGATTFWECWGEEELDRKWGARSLNHPMQGGFDAWFYQGILGINADPAGPGFRHVILHPQMAKELKWARGAYESPYGRIVSDWRSENDDFVWHVVVPPNSSATVYLPDGSPPKQIEAGEYTFRCLAN